MQNKRLATIFGIVFVDLLGFSLILPLLPYDAQAFGADAFVTGLLVASYAVAQLIGAPLRGRMSDRLGRRPRTADQYFRNALGVPAPGIGRRVVGLDRQSHHRWIDWRQPHGGASLLPTRGGTQYSTAQGD